MAGRPPISRGRANLKSKRLIYLTQDDIFRFIENNPSICVQVVTYKYKGDTDVLPTELENMPGTAGPKEPKFAAVVRWVQFWNCEGFEQGERQIT